MNITYSIGRERARERVMKGERGRGKGRICMESGRVGVWRVGEGVYGEWAWGCMVRRRGGVWRVGVGEYGEGARGCMESGRWCVWRGG